MLFNRSTRRAALTDLGQRYYDRTKPLIYEMLEADSELTSRTSSVSGLVRIAASGTFGRLHVLPLIPDPLSLNPDLQVDLVLPDFVRDMVEDRIDLAIRLGLLLNQTRLSGALLPLRSCASDRSRRYFERAIIIQQKTGRRVQFELLGSGRRSILTWLEHRRGTMNDFAFPSRIDHTARISTRHYARLVDECVVGIGLQREEYGTHSLRRTKASIIYKQTGNLRAVQILLGHRTIKSTGRTLN